MVAMRAYYCIAILVQIAYKNKQTSIYNKNFDLGIDHCYKQVDILISKNQALQILYLTHRVYNETTY